MRFVVQLVAGTLLVTISISTTALAGPEADALHQRTLEALVNASEKLDDRTTGAERHNQRQDQQLFEHRQQLENLKKQLPLPPEGVQVLVDALNKMHIDDSVVLAAFDKAKQSGRDDERRAFIDALIDHACKTKQDNCRLRTQIANIEGEYQRLHDLNEKLEIERQRIGERLDALGRGATLGGTYYRGQDPGPAADQPLEPTPVAPVQQAPHLVPQVPHRVSTQRVPVVIGDPSELCRTAKLIQRCADVQLPDGSYYHGNVYRNCNGQHVMITHPKNTRRR